MLAALALDNETAKASDYLVVQTDGPLNADQRSALAKVGAEILEAVPGDAFICYLRRPTSRRCARSISSRGRNSIRAR